MRYPKDVTEGKNLFITNSMPMAMTAIATVINDMYFALFISLYLFNTNRNMIICGFGKTAGNH